MFSTALSSQTDFAGRVIIIGCGSIGQGILPVIGRHLPIGGEGRLLVLSADELGRGLAQKCGAHFEHAHLTPKNHRRILGRHAKAGDLVLNLSVNVSSLDLIRFCAQREVLYVDTSIEPWPGVYANPMLDMRQRTNFVIREKALQLAGEWVRMHRLQSSITARTQAWYPISSNEPCSTWIAYCAREKRDRSLARTGRTSLATWRSWSSRSPNAILRSAITRNATASSSTPGRSMASSTS
jgi:hypothetical protein